MQPLISNLKTTEDILLNYTNIEVYDGIYVNNSLFKLFKNIAKDLTFIRIEKENHVECAIYDYDISDDIVISIYTNAKHDYLELIYFYTIPDFFEDNFIEIINLANRNLRIARVMTVTDHMTNVEVSSVYNGEFSTKSFLKFMNTLHQDIVTFHKITDMYISNLSEHIEKLRNDEQIRKSVNKVASNSKTIKKLTDIKTKKKLKVESDIRPIKRKSK